MSGARLANRTIVVTGAARGVGKAIAEACARQGARVIIGDILADRGKEMVRQLSDLGAKARFVSLDLAAPASIEAFAKDIADDEGRLDGLVNGRARRSSSR